MEKEFIPYAEALALKELGLDKPCFGYYHICNTDELKEIYECDYFFHEKSGNFNSNCLLLKAPLYQQAFRWLLILVNKDEHFSNKWTISYNEDYYSLFLGGCNMGVFKAELECLKKLIEIVKNK